MKYSVQVSLSNGKEIGFGSNLESPQAIHNEIMNQLNSHWHYYKNAHGEGFFKKEEVVHIHVSK
jgi:hypothetical protein